MSKNRLILITGASGFLGTWIADAAYYAGYSLIGIDLRAPSRPYIWTAFATSSLESVDLGQLLQGHSVYAVVHLAGGASVASSVSDPYGDFYGLLPGTARLAIFLAKHQPTARLFLFSSAAVYGNPQTLPISENAQLAPVSPYGIHKAISESLLTHYARVFGLNITIFRVFSVYGPGLKKQLIWDVSQRALEAKANGSSNITLFGTGLESRDFIYVKDLCQAVLDILDSVTFDGVDIYNLASGIESTIYEVAHCLMKHLQIDIDICFNQEMLKADPSNWQADILRLSTLGFKPTYNLDKGLKEVSIWVKSLTFI